MILNVIDEVIEAAQILIVRELNTLASGNISAYLREYGFIVITPSGIGKHKLSRKDLVYYDVDRRVFIGFKKPSIEYRLHIWSYMKCRDANAIVHAHPKKTIVVEKIYGIAPFIMSGLVEFNYYIKSIGVVNEAPPGSEELAEQVSNKLIKNDVVIIPNHGVVARGDTPLECVEKIQVLENTAEHILECGGDLNRG